MKPYRIWKYSMMTFDGKTVWRWRIRTPDGRMVGENYTSESGCTRSLNAFIAAIKEGRYIIEDKEAAR